MHVHVSVRAHACTLVCICLQEAVVHCIKGHDAAMGRSGEWSTAVVSVMRLGVLPGYCSQIIHTRVERAEAPGPVAKQHINDHVKCPNMKLSFAISIILLI